MTRPRAATYHYSIDRDNHLVSVSNTWLDFARENDAPELTRERVVDCSIWDFVAGAKTREIYEMLFAWVRDRGAVISVPFRCDSPDRMRFMKLQLTPSEDAGIDLAAILESEERRPYMRLFERLAPRSDYAFPTCSFCRRVFAFGCWLEPQEAVRRLGWLESKAPPRVEEDVCVDCAQRSRAQAESAELRPGSR
jgi:hypothetical protein